MCMCVFLCGRKEEREREKEDGEGWNDNTESD